MNVAQKYSVFQYEEDRRSDVFSTIRMYPKTANAAHTQHMFSTHQPYCAVLVAAAISKYMWQHSSDEEIRAVS